MGIVARYGHRRWMDDKQGLGFQAYNLGVIGEGSTYPTGFYIRTQFPNSLEALVQSGGWGLWGLGLRVNPLRAWTTLAWEVESTREDRRAAPSSGCLPRRKPETRTC